MKMNVHVSLLALVLLAPVCVYASEGQDAPTRSWSDFALDYTTRPVWNRILVPAHSYTIQPVSNWLNREGAEVEAYKKTLGVVILKNEGQESSEAATANTSDIFAAKRTLTYRNGAFVLGTLSVASTAALVATFMVKSPHAHDRKVQAGLAAGSLTTGLAALRCRNLNKKNLADAQALVFSTMLLVESENSSMHSDSEQE